MRTKQRLALPKFALVSLAIVVWPAAARAQIIRGPYGIYPPYGAYAVPTSDVRIQVSPEKTEVYVDGYYAGVADDFDGVFQRLRVEPGPHVIELYLDGYRSHRESAYLSQGSNHKIRHAMVPLAPGEKNEPRPVPAGGAEAPQLPTDQGPSHPPGRRGPFPGEPRAATPTRGRVGDPGVGPFPPPPGGRQAESRYGTLSIRVQPANADVFVDGQRWPGPDTEPLIVQLSEGKHRIEVRKEGYAPFSTEIEVKSGDTTPLNVSLMGK